MLNGCMGLIEEFGCIENVVKLFHLQKSGCLFGYMGYIQTHYHMGYPIPDWINWIWDDLNLDKICFSENVYFATYLEVS